MTSRRWKHYQPSNIRRALEGCKEFARERHNLSVERIATEMGLEDHWVLYKWIQTGRIPATQIIPFERACGINLVTRWVAAHTGKLLVDIPSGRQAEAEDIQELQEQLNAVTGLLIKFHAGKTGAEDTLAGIQNAMEALAWHRGNVQQHAQPQLEF
ncbi:hypothetical protein [Marinobacterium stanieri]|uniref:Uncharacterized protein n=1 Tax=Marinobacterium stanieri TaxID=49186 RepID=A0A1N6RNM0_9GAMM|nr:hypothetical protein [Marinobacterium stanieri]SIQ30377.1 hypothetical protein SAMN05421647_103434 [Marinobacterium stanieri]